MNADSTDFKHEHEARTREEEILRNLGRELRKLIPPEEWEALDERQRELAFRKAHSLVHVRMGVQHETRVRFTDRGYEEKSGEITVPRSDLNGPAEDAVGILAHELRHAWQWALRVGRSHHVRGSPKYRGSDHPCPPAFMQVRSDARLTHRHEP